MKPAKPTGRSPLTAFAFFVAASIALAAPSMWSLTSAEGDTTTASDPLTLVDSTTPTPTPTATVPVEEVDEDADDAELTGEHPDNHGKAVSTAARCSVKGRAHGELVRTIAQDPDATVADAEAACAGALAAQAQAETDAEGKPAKVHVPKVKPPKPVSAKPVSGKPDHAGGPPADKGSGKDR